MTLLRSVASIPVGVADITKLNRWTSAAASAIEGSSSVTPRARLARAADRGRNNGTSGELGASERRQGVPRGVGDPVKARQHSRAARGPATTWRPMATPAPLTILASGPTLLGT